MSKEIILRCDFFQWLWGWAFKKNQSFGFTLCRKDGYETVVFLVDDIPPTVNTS